VIGPVALREDTRRLRRLLRPGPDGVPRARICSATVSLRRGRIVVTLTCELADLHPQMRHRTDAGAHRSFVGVDRGLSHLVVVAGSDRSEWGRIDPPRHLVATGPALARASRSVSRKVPGSANRSKARARLGRLHARVANRRHDFTHRISSQIAKTHGAICIEDLAVKNMAKNHHLARSINDAAWGELGSQLRYKADWYGATLVVAPRFFASTKTCSSCGWVCEKMTLGERVFRCPACGLIADRDTNAAANLAAWGEAEHCSATQAPDPEARGRVTNACGGRSAGHHLGDGGTAPETPDPGKKQEPVAAPAA
jgi:putative transposase